MSKDSGAQAGTQTQTQNPPISSLAAFLNALSWSRARKDPDFDAGLNASSAWNASSPAARASLVAISGTTNAADAMSVSSDEAEREADEAGGDPDDMLLNDEPGRPARALYTFDGKPEFRELTGVEAGDRLEVLREEVGDGWSLVRHFPSREEGKGRAEVGLVPCTYYTYTADFAHAPDLELPPTSSSPRHATLRSNARRNPSGSSVTPRGSPTRELEDPSPIIPQTTGEWFPSFRRSLLGGKQLNRFSSFVTSGAEEWVLQGTSESSCAETSTEPYRHIHEKSLSTSSLNGDGDSSLANSAVTEADRHYVEAGPAWRTKLPPFRILIHSPSRRSSMLSGAYTMYAVTSLFDTDAEDQGYAEDERRPASPMRITVYRRFSHFVVLHTALTRRLPGIALPPLPEKQYAGRFSDDFVEARRGDLERYMSRVVRHPVARYAEVLTFFLGCENDVEWKKQFPKYLALPAAGPTFFAHVFHPAYNLDSDEAAEVAERFENHTRAVGKGVQTLRSTYGKVREASLEMSKAQRLLAYSLLSMITSKPLAAGSNDVDDDQEDRGRMKGHMNEEGAWCWREGCDAAIRFDPDCLRLTKAMQKTSETLQGVADLYDDHARRTQLVTHEGLKSVAHPEAVYAGVVETHKAAVTRYQEATQDGCEDAEVAARCETVLNTTMAEFETYHTQKVEDFHALTTELLDGEIELYEQILARLTHARNALSPPTYPSLSDTPRISSIYERELENPRLKPEELTMPCPHVYDSAPMRPVSVAIQEGVGLLMSPVRAGGRGSVFQKFW